MKKILYSVMALAIAAMTFTACEDVPEPYPTPTPTNGSEAIEGATGDGTLENPFNAIAATNAAKELGSGNVSEQVYYIKGKVVSIAIDKNGNVQNYDYGTWGNASFYISDDGTSANQFYCYRVLYLGNKAWKSGAGDILKEGDEVIVCAKLTMYNTTPETQQNEGFLYSLNGKTEGGAPEEPGVATGDGTLANPFNAVAANAAAGKLADQETSSEAYYIKGKVAEIKYNYGEGKFPKTADFLISDDGTSGNTFYIYACKYLGNKDYTSGDVLALGDEVIVYGNLYNYKGTLETAQGKNYLYSWNGKTEAGGETPDPQPTGNYGTAETPLTVAKALEVIAALEMKGTTPEEAYVKGKVVSVDNYNSQYNSLTYYISDDGTATNQLQVYSGKGLDGAAFASKDDLKPGAEVVVKGTLKKFASGDSYIPEFDKNSVIISIANNEGGGETPDTPDTPDTPATGNTITATMQSFGLADATDLNMQTLSDGTTLTFAAEANSNAPKYYNNGTNARVYAQNSLTIKSTGKKITKVVLTCTPNYLGNNELYGEAGGQKVTIEKASPDIIFSGFNDTTLKIVNDYKEPKSGTQLRIVSITITYAE